MVFELWFAWWGRESGDGFAVWVAFGVFEGLDEFVLEFGREEVFHIVGAAVYVVGGESESLFEVGFPEAVCTHEGGGVCFSGGGEA